MPRSLALIRRLRLEPHPEGGYYREVYRSGDQVVGGQGGRSAVTTIYFLLAKGQRSLLHRVLADEIWHFYEGAPLRLLRFSPNLVEKEILTLGTQSGKRQPVAVIPNGYWQAAETKGDYTLVGCTVGPGFDFSDFLLLRDDKVLSARFRRKYPDSEKWVG